jgi:hypothetical protein
VAAVTQPPWLQRLARDCIKKHISLINLILMRCKFKIPQKAFPTSTNSLPHPEGGNIINNRATNATQRQHSFHNFESNQCNILKCTNEQQEEGTKRSEKKSI